MSIKSIHDAIVQALADDEKAKPADLPTDPSTIILRQFLAGAPPVETFGPGVSVMSTDDIIQELSNMADLSQLQVNLALTSLGYRLGRNTAGSFGWLIRMPVR